MTQYRLKRRYSGKYEVQYKRWLLWRTVTTWCGDPRTYEYEQAVQRVNQLRERDLDNFYKKHYKPVYLEEPFPREDPFAE